MTTRLALIHATRVAIDPIEDAARRLWPEAELVSLLEEGLSLDRRKSADLTSDLRQRIVALGRYAQSAGAHAVLYTCSAFGEAIDEAKRELAIPALKPNEAMFTDAFAHGDRIAMIYTFEPAAAGLEAEFREEAASKGSKALLTSHFCDEALAAKRDGDHETHDRLIAETASRIAETDAIMLAQFSMASAADRVRQAAGLPVLTSPDAAIKAMREKVEP